MSYSPEDELRENYLTWTRESLVEMKQYLSHAMAAEDTDRDAIDAIYGIAHNIKGMGGSFGFPLMTHAGTSLCRYLRSLDGAEPSFDVIEAHVKSFEVIMTNQITGEGGDMGAKLVSRLELLVDRSLAMTNPNKAVNS